MFFPPAWLRRNQSSNHYFTTEAQSSQSSEYFLIKNSLLRALRASAVRSLSAFQPIDDRGHSFPTLEP